MKKLATILTLIITLLIGGLNVNASNAGKPLTQYYLVDATGGQATLRSKSQMGKMLKSLGFKIVSSGATFKATRNGTTVTMTKIRNGNKCIINFASQSEVNQFVESMNKSGWGKSGNSYMHPNVMFGGGVHATVNGRTVTLIYEWDGSI